MKCFQQILCLVGKNKQPFRKYICTYILIFKDKFPLSFYLFTFETWSHSVSKLVSNLWQSFCLSLLSAGIADVHHLVWLIFCFFNNCFFLFPTDYVPYVNAVDSRWSSYGNEATSSAHYIDR